MPLQPHVVISLLVKKRKEQVLRLLFLFVLMEYVNSHIKSIVRNDNELMERSLTR